MPREANRAGPDEAHAAGTRAVGSGDAGQLRTDTLPVTVSTATNFGASVKMYSAETDSLTAIVIETNGEIAAAVIYAGEPTSISILQIAALAPAAAVSALRAVAGEAAGRPVRLVNVAADGMIALAAGRLGSAVDHVQCEMRLSLAARPGDERPAEDHTTTDCDPAGP
jgi:hypothetical protein